MSANPDEAPMGAKEMSLPKASQRKVDAGKLIIVLQDNIRHAKDSGGADTYQLSELEDAVRTAGMIREPLVLEEQPDGLHVRRGFRRALVAQRILGDSKAPAELHEAMRKIPALVYPGPLSEIQRLALINDQNNKKFVYSELVKLVFKYFEAGLTWPEVAFEMYRQWAEVTGNRKILNEVDVITGEGARKKRVNKWLQGSFQKVFGAAFNLGPNIMNMIVREAMEQDRLIKTKKNTPDDADQKGIVDGPFCYLLGKQDRLASLSNAKTVDLANAGWDPHNGGLEYNNLLQKFHDEDYNPKAAKEETIKSLSHATLNELAVKGSQSKAVRAAYQHAAGHPKVDWIGADRDAAEMEAKKAKWLMVREFFPEGSMYRRAFDIILVEKIETFNNWLEEHADKPEATSEQKPETTKKK